jgi:hypothetical protein
MGVVTRRVANYRSYWNVILHSIKKKAPPCLTFATKLTRKQNDFCVYQEEKLGVTKGKKMECLINGNWLVYRPCFAILVV